MDKKEFNEIIKRLRNDDKSLKVLYLHNNNISDAGAKELAQALKVNNSLTVLDLYNNNISDVGAKEIAQALKVNNSLTVLDLYNNNISDEYMEFFNNYNKGKLNG